MERERLRRLFAPKKAFVRFGKNGGISRRLRFEGDWGRAESPLPAAAGGSSAVRKPLDGA